MKWVKTYNTSDASGRHWLINANYPHLERAQVGEYVQQYLAYAGADHDIFSDNAVDEIFRFSEGAARLIKSLFSYSTDLAGAPT
jgi:type II secretory pathway predicted ATPase ExeA